MASMAVRGRWLRWLRWLTVRRVGFDVAGIPSWNHSSIPTTFFSEWPRLSHSSSTSCHSARSASSGTAAAILLRAAGPGA